MATDVRAVATPESADLVRLLRLSSIGAKLIFGLFAGTEIVMWLTAGGKESQTWQGILGLALVLAAAARTVLPGSFPLPFFQTLAIVATVPLSTALIIWQLWTTGWPGYGAWVIGANMFVMIALGLRGRSGWAAVGMLLLIAAVLSWAISTDQGVVHGLLLVSREAGTFVLGTIFAVLLRRTARRIHEFNVARERQAAEDAAAAASASERTQQIDRLLTLIGPALQKIAESAAVVMTPDDRLELTVTEAFLRDTIRGRLLAVEPLVTAVEHARRTGITVELLDDSGDPEFDADSEQKALSWIVERLAAVAAGTFTARIVAVGDELELTVVADGSADALRVPRRRDVGSR